MSKSENVEEETTPQQESPKRHRNRVLKLYLLTWNINSKPPPENLPELFRVSADIFAVGLQELGYDNWVPSIDAAFIGEDVVRIKTRRLQGMMVVVYVQRRLLPYVTRIESEITRTGFGGLWGNKGGISIRFEICGVNIVIVNSHLAAHMDQVAQRLQDVNDIVDTQKFRDEEVNCILDHDYVFWMGDLNFRLDKTSYKQALKLINTNSIEELLKRDQLKSVMNEELIFQNFQEAPINFLPTYKFDIGTDNYDTSVKKRVPAYCDRILFFHFDITYGKKDNLDIQCHNYQSHPSFVISDHKPVSTNIDFLTLSRPPNNPISFKVDKFVSRKFPLSVSYTSHNMELSSSDWIGLFYADFIDFTKYIVYYYAAVCSSSKHPKSSITISPSYFANIPEDSKLVLCYFSKKYAFSGISKILTLKD